MTKALAREMANLILFYTTMSVLVCSKRITIVSYILDDRLTCSGIRAITFRFASLRFAPATVLTAMTARAVATGLVRL